jgi:hypothetical protein
VNARIAFTQRRKVAQLYKESSVRVADIARRFGISPGQVSKIADEFHLTKRGPGRTFGNPLPDCGGLSEHRLLCRHRQRELISQTYWGAW